MICAGSVHYLRKDSLALVLSHVSTLHHVDHICASMVWMMELIAKAKYSLFSSST